MNNDKQKLKISSNSSGYFYTLLVCLTIFCSLLYSLIISVVAKNKNVSIEIISNLDVTIIISFFVSTISILLCSGLFFLKFRVNAFEVLKPQKQTKNSMYVYLGVFLIFIGLTFGLGEVNNYFVDFLKKLNLKVSGVSVPKKSPLFVILSIIFICVLPAIFEEYVFRGVILNGYKEKGELFAILFSGFLFSLFHMSPVQTVYQFIVGSIFSFVAIRSSSVYPTILAHFLNNLYVILNYYFFNIQFFSSIKIITSIVGTFLLCLGLFIIKIKTQKTIKSNASCEKNKSVYLGIGIALIFWVVGLF